MSKTQFRNSDADVNEIRKLFQQTKFKAPGGEEGNRKFMDFFKKHNPGSYQEYQELAK